MRLSYLARSLQFVCVDCLPYGSVHQASECVHQASEITLRQGSIAAMTFRACLTYLNARLADRQRPSRLARLSFVVLLFAANPCHRASAAESDKSVSLPSKQQIGEIKAAIPLPVEKKLSPPADKEANSGSNSGIGSEKLNARKASVQQPTAATNGISQPMSTIEQRVRAALEGKLGSDGEVILKIDGDLQDAVDGQRQTNASTNKESATAVNEARRSRLGNRSRADAADKELGSNQSPTRESKSVPQSGQVKAIARTSQSDSGSSTIGQLRALSKHEGPSWSFSGDRGPNTWGQLDPEFATCSSGKSQSPIAISSDLALEGIFELPRFSWDDADFRVQRSEWRLRLILLTNSVLRFREMDWRLHDIQFRVPGEHPVDMVLPEASIALQFQHRHRVLVLNVPVFGRENMPANPAIRTIMQRIPLDQSDEVTTTNMQISPAALIPKSLEGAFLYVGSLSTPPCKEDVIHIVLKTPLLVSSEQLAEIGSFAPKGVRPTQAQNGRIVFVVRQSRH